MRGQSTTRALDSLSVVLPLVGLENEHQPYLRRLSGSQLSEFPVCLCVSNHIIDFMFDIWKPI